MALAKKSTPHVFFGYLCPLVIWTNKFGLLFATSRFTVSTSTSVFQFELRYINFNLNFVHQQTWPNHGSPYFTIYWLQSGQSRWFSWPTICNTIKTSYRDRVILISNFLVFSIKVCQLKENFTNILMWYIVTHCWTTWGDYRNFWGVVMFTMQSKLPGHPVGDTNKDIDYSVTN